MDRKQLFSDLAKAKAKMITACQNGSKKAWRKYGKEVFRLSQELNLPVQPWMKEFFGRIDNSQK